MMNSRLLITAVCVLTLCCSATEGRSVSVRVRKLEREMNRLAKDVAVLQKENVQIKALLQSFMNGTAAYCANGSSTNNSSQTSSASSPDIICTDGLKVKVTSLKSSNKSVGLQHTHLTKNYAIDYTLEGIKLNPAQYNHMTYWVYSGYRFGHGFIPGIKSGLISGSNISQGLGITKSVPYEDGSTVFFVFGNHQDFYVIQIDNSRNFSGTTTKEVMIPRFVNLPEEILYSPGEPITFKISMVSDKMVDLWPLMDLVVDAETNKTFRDWYPPSTEEHKTFTENSCNDGWSTTYTWNISWDVPVDVAVTGLVRLKAMADVEEEDHPVIKRVEVHRNIRLRPRNQVGHFPQGFLSFVNEIPSELNSRGEKIVYCSESKVCKLECEVASGGIGDVEMTIIRYGKRKQKINREKISLSNPIQLHFIEYNVPYTSRRRDQQYRCMAKDLLSKKTVKRNFLVKWVRMPHAPKLTVTVNTSDNLLIVLCHGVGKEESSLEIETFINGDLVWLNELDSNGTFIFNDGLQTTPLQRSPSIATRFDLNSYDHEINDSSKLTVKCVSENASGASETVQGPMTLSELKDKRRKGRGRGKWRGRGNGRKN